MEININDRLKCVEIWLTKAESADDAFRESLAPLYKHYKSNKYRVVVFESGKGDLLIGTKDLLRHAIECGAKHCDC